MSINAGVDIGLDDKGQTITTNIKKGVSIGVGVSTGITVPIGHSYTTPAVPIFQFRR